MYRILDFSQASKQARENASILYPWEDDAWWWTPGTTVSDNEQPWLDLGHGRLLSPGKLKLWQALNPRTNDKMGPYTTMGFYCFLGHIMHILERVIFKKRGPVASWFVCGLEFTKVHPAHLLMVVRIFYFRAYFSIPAISVFRSIVSAVSHNCLRCISESSAVLFNS